MFYADGKCFYVVPLFPVHKRQIAGTLSALGAVSQLRPERRAQEFVFRLAKYLQNAQTYEVSLVQLSKKINVAVGTTAERINQCAENKPIFVRKRWTLVLKESSCTLYKNVDWEGKQFEIYSSK